MDNMWLLGLLVIIMSANSQDILINYNTINYDKYEKYGSDK